jgi:TolB protein
VSPDGETVVYASGQERGVDLFAVPFGGGSPRRITVGRGTDNMSPSFSPDGRRIAFTTGRLGHPEVYITDADGTNAEVLTQFTYGEQSYRSDPDWSPDGRLVAFQSLIGGVFQVMTISLRDKGVKQLTSEGRNEAPAWAPDSRHLVVASTRTGQQQLFVIDAETRRARQLTRGGGGARMGAWSPWLSTP